MLVNRKQQSDFYQRPEEAPVVKDLPKLDIALRVKCLITVLVVATVVVVITVRSEAIVRSGYELVQMKSQVLSLQKENEVLRLDIARLRSPQRIQEIAMGELGMVMPKNIYYAENLPGSAQPNNENDKKLVSKLVSKQTANSGQ